jgi:hypothetical protein
MLVPQGKYAENTFIMEVLTDSADSKKLCTLLSGMFAFSNQQPFQKEVHLL